MGKLVSSVESVVEGKWPKYCLNHGLRQWMALMSQHLTSGTLTWRQPTTRGKFDDSNTQLYFLCEDKTFGFNNHKWKKWSF